MALYEWVTLVAANVLASHPPFLPLVVLCVSVCWVAFRPAANGGAARDGLNYAQPRSEQSSMLVCVCGAQIIDR